ncbi:MAG TPA: aromatic-ring-hydroxylating dioxygenase subunit beta [Burkholderiaceae bacterium]|nr:aromatic-ring-hydroxylating dioxygenase subunit beta [Burkholderiaceae bacterium]
MDLSRLDRVQAEDFLILEAALLDEWKLTEWRELFTEQCLYIVPNMLGDPHAPLTEQLHLIADDGHHLTERVKRLGKRTAHAEWPRSRTRRLISNVRIVSRDAGSVLTHCSFVTYRASQEIVDTFFGRHEHTLVVEQDRLRIREKRTILDMGVLRPQGRLSIIV